MHGGELIVRRALEVETLEFSPGSGGDVVVLKRTARPGGAVKEAAV